MRTAILVASCLLAWVPALAGAEPALRLDAPSGWTGADGSYQAPGGEAELLITPFRPFDGAFDAAFKESWRGARLRAEPQLSPVQVKGADQGMVAILVEDQGGAPRVRVRIGVAVGHAMAFADFTTMSQAGYERHWPAALAALDAMSVGTTSTPPPAAPASTAPPPPATATGKGLGGMYTATVLRRVFRADFSGRTSGSWDMEAATEVYLFSDDAKVYHTWGIPDVPGGDVRRFDYEAARKKDPGNVGSYRVSGKEAAVTLGNDSFTAAIVDGGLVIRKTTFKKAKLR